MPNMLFGSLSILLKFSILRSSFRSKIITINSKCVFYYRAKKALIKEIESRLDEHIKFIKNEVNKRRYYLERKAEKETMVSYNIILTVFLGFRTSSESWESLSSCNRVVKDEHVFLNILVNNENVSVFVLSHLILISDHFCELERNCEYVSSASR